MKTKVFLIMMLLNVSVWGQKDINLDLIHHYNGTPFSYGTIYSTAGGDAVMFDRVQYYLTGFEIEHDGGQTISMTDAVVLASGNITSYTLGNENITTLEGVNFDLGVDIVNNHKGTSYWPAGHPLSAQTPEMDWGWPSGYFFFVIDGKIDDTGDGTPNKVFQLRGIGDELLRDVNAFSGLNLSDAAITLAFDVNIADWVMNLDLALVGFDHSASANNIMVADNTNNETVFTISAELGTGEIALEENKIYANYEFAYAPTIFYDLATNDPIDIRVFDMSGRLQLESLMQNPEGNYFIEKELPTGSYMIYFTNDEVVESFKFVVQN